MIAIREQSHSDRASKCEDRTKPTPFTYKAAYIYRYVHVTSRAVRQDKPRCVTRVKQATRRRADHQPQFPWGSRGCRDERRRRRSGGSDVRSWQSRGNLHRGCMMGMSGWRLPRSSGILSPVELQDDLDLISGRFGILIVAYMMHQPNVTWCSASESPRDGTGPQEEADRSIRLE